MLAKYKIKSVAIPPRKISSDIPPTKDPTGLRTPGIYKIPCECGKVYIGQSGRLFNSALRNMTDISDYSNQKNQQ
jgi:hypothetical protein